MSTEDNSFHPLGAEWEAELEQTLEESEYDAQLGLEMAKDAQRVTAGELSEAEFHERYHEQVLEEFGVDDRPSAEAYEELQEAADEDGGLTAALDRFQGDGDVDRRDAMKKMGAGAAFLGMAGLTASDDGTNPSVAAADGEDDDEGKQWGMVIDLERCDGCLSCVDACDQENGLDGGVNWMYVLAYEDETGRGEDEEPGLLVRPCQHCDDAPCERVCPTTARHTRSKDGLVLTDYDVCIGCRYCQVACPYGVNYFQWEEPGVTKAEITERHEHHMEEGEDHFYADYDEEGEDQRWVDSRAPRGVMSKCTMCPTRQDGHKGEGMVGTTACQEACPPGAIQFGDVNDPDDDPMQYLDDVAVARANEELPADPDNDDETDAEIRRAVQLLQGEIDEDEAEMEVSEARVLVDGHYGDESSTFKLLEEVGTNPNVTYIGNEPGPNAEQISPEEARERGLATAVDYETLDLVDRRKDVTDEGTLGGGLLP